MPGNGKYEIELSLEPKYFNRSKTITLEAEKVGDVIHCTVTMMPVPEPGISKKIEKVIID